MKANQSFWIMVTAAFIMFAAGTQGQVPQVINYQGQLTDAGGSPLTGAHTIVFEIWDAPTGGTALWDETHSVTISADANGFVSRLLGKDGTPPKPIPSNLFDSGTERYLQLTVDGSVLSPRQQLGSVPYGFRSQGTLDQGYDQGGPGAGRTITADAGAVNIAGPDGLTVNGNVGIGTTNPTAKLHVLGSGTIGRLGSSLDGVVGHSFVIGGAGVTGFSNGDGSYGVYGKHISSTNYGYLGSSNSGVYGSNSAPSGAGVYGTSSNDGSAVYGANNTGNYGAIADPVNGVVGVGSSSVSNGAGVFGGSFSSSGTGVYGLHYNNGAPGNYGYLGSSNYGVYGSNSATSGAGVYGTSSNDGVAIYGINNNGNYGAIADALDGLVGVGSSLVSGGAGVFGMKVGGGNYAGYFDGNVHITGTLSKGGGSFKIDHPLDPENKYLSHSFVESPDMKNVYDGIATLDARGEAVVQLPDYFQALNNEYRYQLTCIGGYAPVYIAEKITKNRFKIAGGTSGLEVSWQVTGIRQDAFAQTHRIQVEAEKTGKERGKYLYPREHGMPESMGMEYERIQRMEQERKAHAERIKAEQEQMKVRGEQHRLEREKMRQMEQHQRPEEK